MPKVSVVIPTKNRCALLAEAIERIESQTVPREQYEVIVIDNDSTDDTRMLLEQKARLYPNLKHGMQEKPGAAATRNSGLRLASGELILFIDDDVQAERTLIQAHLDCHARNPNASVIGVVNMPWDDTTDPFLRYLRDHRILNPYTPSKGPIDFSYYHTGNVSTPTQTLLNVGGFNESFSVYGMEDIELGYRLQKSGCRMVFAAEARAVHYRFPGYRDFVERSEQAGYSLGYLIHLHPELKKRFVGSSRIARPLKSFHPLYRWAAAAVSPLVTLIAKWERTRGTAPLTRLMDLHYKWSIRYHFFLGYQRYWKDQKRIRHEQLLAPMKSALAKEYQMKAKGEL
jgi:glycosyltransferase involved in cell wall biosynthesis